ncbi:MAG: hypothetical protein J2P57_22120, partial [Acidimicrobiaceae bacterium]|nr:hypothetical protein [Acidimicrobiaceae bacterium]
GLAYDRRRAERMTALGSPMVQRVVGGTRAQRLGNELMAKPLLEVLEAGVAADRFPTAQPELDVHTIGAVTMEAVAWARTPSGDSVRLTRREALEHVLRFAEGALGVR